MWSWAPDLWLVRRLRRLRPLGLLAIAVSLALYVWWPMIAAAPWNVDGDGRYFMHQWDVAKVSILEDHELPLWNPFDCKGIPLWDHPESMIGSPILMLATPLPPVATVWVWNLSHCVAGFLSMWVLARRGVLLGRASALVASVMWASAVSHTSQYAGAHATLADFWLVPLLLYLWRRSERDGPAAVMLGLALAFMVYEGATYPLPFALLIVGLETLTRLSPRRAPAILRAGAVAGLVAIGTSAARLLPLMIELRSKQRDAMLPDVDDLARADTLRRMLLWREGHWWARLRDQQYVWGEYIAYVGYIALGLAAVGLLISLRERLWLVILAAMTALLMLGHFADWAPWELLNHHVFPFRSMRVPSRFRLIMQMFFALWVGLAIDRVPRMIDLRIGNARFRPGRLLKPILIGLAFVALVDGIGFSRRIVEWMHKGAPLHVVAREPEFYYGGPDLADWPDQPRQNRAQIGCRAYEWPAHMDAAVWVGKQPQVRALGSIALSEVARTQNAFAFTADVSGPGRVYLNSAHAAGWRANVGEVSNQANLLALDLPLGHHRVRVHYWPPLFTLGIVVTSVSNLAVLGYFIARFVRKRRGTAGERR